MKRIITLFFLIACIGNIYSQNVQEKANFTLLETGLFVDSITGDSFIVVPFEGKTAEELYQLLMENASLATNDPNHQVSGVENSVVKVRARQHLLTDVVMMLPLSCTGTMIYEFQIKDGKVRVNAPTIEEPCHYGTSDKTCYFRSVAKGYFKKGKLKEKKADEYNRLINKTNNVLNIILGVKSMEQEQNDW